MKKRSIAGRSTRRARVLGPTAAIVAAIALGAGSVAAQGPKLGPPLPDPAGGARWTAPALPSPEWLRSVAAPTTRADSLRFWRLASGQALVREAALNRLAGLSLAVGDTAAADSCWARAGGGAWPTLGASPWAWSAVAGRASIALARADTARADSLLEAAPRLGWTDADRAAWLALHLRLRLALRDTTRALALARQAIRVYPGLPVTVQPAVLLESIAAARRDSLSAADELALSAVFAGSGDLRGSIRPLRRARAVAPKAERALWSARIATPLRRLRRFAEARAALDSAFRSHPRGEALALAALERARLHRDQGATDLALRAFDRAARAATGADDAQQAWWEGGRSAESNGRWRQASTLYARAAAAGGRRTPEAFFRAGLARFSEGRLDSACVWWRGRAEEPARFWWGVARRALGDHAAGDSTLLELARNPGYTFYRAAARDTLGVRGWNGAVWILRPDEEAACPEVRVAAALAAAGDDEDAATVLSRLSGVTSWSFADSSQRDPLRESLVGARIAHAAGRPVQAVTLADRAVRLAAARDSTGAAAWSLVPWSYPPAYESLFVAPRDTAAARFEPALLYAVTWQESRFNPAARSRSDALGLMQLKLSTARDVARWTSLPAPAESSMFDPETSVRFGTRYLRRLIDRFEGRLPVALSAYNAGPASLPDHWRELIARGGEALFCEIASNADAQDYLRRILAARQAYREIHPRGPSGAR